MLPKVLAVDDEEMILDILEEILTEDRLFSVDKAKNGKDALTKATTNEYRIILLDFRMPIMSGDVFVKELRSGASKNKNTPILFVTANPEEAEPLIKDYENVSLLVKPIDMKSLAYKIREAMVASKRK